MTTLAADICVSGADASLQLSAVILDVFTELMLANCASIQAVLSNYLADGGSQDTFYRAKADFASELIARGDAATLFEQYLPDRYACFATLAREDFLATMDEDEMASLASLWSQFLRERFSAYFLSVDQAVALVRNEPFHRARPELTVGSGVRPGGRMRYGFVDEAELRSVLSDKQVVLGTGAYVLCLLTGKPSDAEIGKIGNSFGWRRQADSVPKRLRLCTEDNYHEMIPFVRKGFVTPVRLFLKAS
ncbi:hypothetical protein GCM10010833_08150 [Blastomonas aquatica]|uniref:DNA-binding domain-containing protein n=2 Tax=Blastomonas aquatica TaxID=1510276 RepID=A0ABQ1IYX6_9SPHN|nr:hypothetical protein GCM10010833_08150 [Blastomonas aquatica]